MVNQSELAEIYETGTGKIRVRGRTTVEKGKNGKQYLVITEIPYPMVGANIGKFLCDVADLVEKRQAPEISDISNQSSKEGIRIVLELRKGADVERLRSLLYRKTHLEDTFGVNMLAVVDGRPETLSLKAVLEHFTEFQFDLATRKYNTLLAKELEKKEIQEGLIRAVDVIDLIIEILRGSRNQQMARDCMTMGITEGIRFRHKSSEKKARELCFTQRQAQAILDMRLAKLIGLELEALYKENEETIQKIARYEDILNSYDSMAEVILEDLDAIRKEYGRPRRTEITEAAAEAPAEEEEKETELVFLMDRFGYARTIDPAVYEKNQEAADAENRFRFRCMSSDKVCIFTDLGTMHTIRVRDVPYGKLRDKGTPIDNLCHYSAESERVIFAAAMQELQENRLLFVSAEGMVKIVDGSEFCVTKRSIAATKLGGGDDSLVLAGFAGQGDFLVLQSTDGFFIRFALSEIPEKKKTAIGVRGIRLNAGAAVEAAYITAAGKEYTIPWNDRQLSLNRLKLAKRDGKGSKVK